MSPKEGAIPAEGAKAPAFTLENHQGGKTRLSDLKGRHVVLYFYPKDDTSGCTVEANEFQEHLGRFEEQNAVVLGVSPDPVKSHCKFSDKYGLAFPLLADTEHEVAGKYGVWVKKSMYGREYMGIQRATFLIDPNGRIARVWPKVSPKGHAGEVLAALAEQG